jgi:hypothetical protein
MTGRLMRKMWLWRCSCGSVVRAILQIDPAASKDAEPALCPTCMKKQAVEGDVLELLVVYHQPQSDHAVQGTP